MKAFETTISVRFSDCDLVILYPSYRLMYLPFDEASVPDFLTLQKKQMEKSLETIVTNFKSDLGQKVGADISSTVGVFYVSFWSDEWINKKSIIRLLKFRRKFIKVPHKKPNQSNINRRAYSES